MNIRKLREYFIMQVELVNEVTKDIVKHNASDEILDYAVEVGHCNLDGSEDEFIRVEFGGAYAYLDIENGKPVGKPIWWNNEDLGCGGCDYKRTIARLNTMTDEEILNIPEVSYIAEDDELSVPAYVPYCQQSYEVVCQSNDGDDSVIGFDTAEAADDFIEKELENVKSYYVKNGINYDYVDVPNSNGNITTKIYECGGDTYNRWIRKW